MTKMRVALLTGLAVSVGGVAHAEDLTISTYYPSPRGVYQELRTTNNAFLATQGGAVGIGTTSPTNVLTVRGGNGDFGDANVSVEMGSAGGVATVWGWNGNANNAHTDLSLRATPATQLYLRTDGNVGIGTTSPGAKLQVTGDALITSTLNLGSIGIVGGTRGTLSFGGVNGVADGFIINNTEGNYLKFQSDTYPSTAFFVLETGGNVGIGTTTPGAALDVRGGAARILSGGSAGSSTDLYVGNVFSNYRTAVIRVYDGNGTPASSKLHIFHWGAPEGQLTVQGDGNVGIGTASPVATLDTVGLIRATNVGAALNPASGKGLEIQYVISGRAQGEGAYLIPYDRTANAYKPFTIDALNMNFSTGGLTRMVIVPNGSVMISDPAGNWAPGNSDRFQVNGNIYAMGTIHAQSDIRFKTNIEPLAGTLGKLDQLRAVSYERNELGMSGRQPDGGREFGVIGQELQQVFPELVSTGSTPEKYLAVDYSRLSVVLLEAVKELKVETETLRSEVRALKAEKQKELKP